MNYINLEDVRLIHQKIILKQKLVFKNGRCGREFG